VPTYVDTSALLRLIEDRGDVAAVRAAMADTPLTSTLVDVECWASIHKKWHDREITATQRDALLVAVGAVLLAVNLLALNEDVLTETRVLTQRYPLRTLDGIHLATAVRAQGPLTRAAGGLRFCTADRRQADAARECLGSAQVDFVPPWRTEAAS
jgi:predicted nucleic acid-binding protein